MFCTGFYVQLLLLTRKLLSPQTHTFGVNKGINLNHAMLYIAARASPFQILSDERDYSRRKIPYNSKPFIYL